MKITARDTSTRKPIEIQLNGSTIDSIHEATESADLPWICPGFFDIQLNGYKGVWFCSPDLTVDDVVKTIHSLVATGITRCFPTLITASQEALKHGFQILEKAREADAIVRHCVTGYHLEGPYISAEDGPRGAHPIAHVRPADVGEFEILQQAAGGRIRLVTLAAEAGNAVEFIKQIRSQGVVVALGHTGGTPEQIQEAVDAGAQLSTHFGNGAHGTLRRHPNYLWEQLGEDRLWASVIADGHHLPDSVLKCVLKCKKQKTILTCDVSGFAGCAPGTYSEGDVAVDVLEDGRLVVSGQQQFLAGSGAVTGDCVVHMAESCDLTLHDAVQMASSHPAELFQEKLPTLEAGQEATFTVFNILNDPGATKGRFAPVSTYVHGHRMPAGG